MKALSLLLSLLLLSAAWLASADPNEGCREEAQLLYHDGQRGQLQACEDGELVDVDTSGDDLEQQVTEALRLALKHLKLSTDGLYDPFTYSVYIPPRPPAQSLREEADAIEAKDADIARIREILTAWEARQR